MVPYGVLSTENILSMMVQAKNSPSQSISLVLYLLKGKKCEEPVLVVCPLSMLSNWEE